MNRPRRFLLRMVAFLIIVAAVVFVLRDALASAFAANPPLNGLILGVLLLGVAFAFRQVLGLWPEARWIEAFRAGAHKSSSPPRLLAPMARMLEDRTGRVMLSALAMRSLLDSIGARLDESREISRYMIGLLIFLGLLGTFWGLLDTVGSVGAVIAGLNVEGDDLVGVFATLKTNLEAPLAGMGTAFSSSLFGLAGSLVLGFLDLQTGQAQNQFYNDLEEWLSSVTRLSSGSGVADGEQSVPVYVQALLEKTADSLEELQRTLARGEEDRRAANAQTTRLTEQLAALADHMTAQQDTMSRLADSGGGGLDEATRGHVRNLDVHLARLLQETVDGRNYLASELRGEIKLLGRMLAAASAAPESAGTPPPEPEPPRIESPPEPPRVDTPPEAPPPPPPPRAAAPAAPSPVRPPRAPAAPRPAGAPAARPPEPPPAPEPRRPATPPRAEPRLPGAPPAPPRVETPRVEAPRPASGVEPRRRP